MNVVYEELVGGTIAWNQLCGFNISAYSTYWKKNSSYEIEAKTSISSNATYPQIIASGAGGWKVGHKYYYKVDNKTSGTLSYYYKNSDYSFGRQVSANSSREWVVNCDSAFNLNYFVNQGSTIQTGEKVYTNVFDLTLMFGTTIADYVYSLERATVGSGIAWLKKYGFFTKPYYANNAGELMSVKTSAHMMTGFNQWDEDWELGYYNLTTGEAVSSTTTIRSKNIIQVLPNTTYFFYCGTKSTDAYRVLFYDENKNFISSLSSSTLTNNTATTPANCFYMHFYFASSYGTTYKNDICINISSSRNGEYESFKKYEYPLANVELRGIPKLDANNNLYYDGDIYESSGKVTRKYGYVDLGTLTWDLSSTVTNGFVATGNMPNDWILPANGSAIIEAICSKGYKAVSTNEWQQTSNPDKVMAYRIPGSGKGLAITDSAFSGYTKEQVKTALSGQYIVYRKNAETTEENLSYPSPQICFKNGTEQYIDNREVEIPVGHNSIYCI